MKANHARSALSARIGKLPISVVYTIGFAVIAIIGFSPLLVNGKSFINTIDGVAQQFNAFICLGQLVRQAIRDGLSGQGWQLPWYDFSMGYGSPRTYSFDPLAYVSVLVPKAYAEYAFNAVAIVRLWLAGLVLLPLAKRLRISRNWAVVSAWVYVFSSAGFNIILQVGFLNHLIMFPLVVYGALVLLEEKRPFIFIAASAGACLLSGLYVLYMMELLVAVYVVVRFCVDRAGPLLWAKTFVMFLACIAVAGVIAAPVSLSNFFSISTIDRISVQYSHPLLYSAEYYQQMFAGFLGMRSGGRDWFFGYGALALLACALLFVKKFDDKRAARILQVLLIVGSLFLCIPMCGAAFNGFTYVVNRWVFGFALLIAVIVGYVGTHGFALERKEVVACAVVLGVYTLLMALLPEARGKAAWIQLVLAWAFLAVLAIPKISGKQTGNGLRGQKTAVALLAVVALCTNMIFFLAPFGDNWQRQLIASGTALDRTAYKTPIALVAKTDDSPPYRFDRSSTQYSSVLTSGLNAARVLGVIGVDHYTSLYNNAVDRFHADLGLVCSGIPNVFSTLDQRSMLEQLLGVKYYIARNDDLASAPYETLEKPVASMKVYTGRKYLLYEIADAAPVAQVFNAAMRESTYNELTPLDKQEALIQAVVLEDDLVGSGIDVALSGKQVDSISIQATDGVEVDGGRVVVKRSDATLTVSCEAGANCETYLYVTGLQFESVRPADCYDDNEWAALTDAEREQVLEEDSAWEKPSSYRLKARTNNHEETAQFSTPDSHLYGGKDTWLWNLGYFEQGASSVEIVFDEPGIYEFSDFQVLTQTMDALDDAKKRASQAEVGLTFGKDEVSLDVNGHEGEYLFIAIPYDQGWSASANGEPADLLRADTAFMALVLSEGENHVVLSYVSPVPPYYAAGLLMCAICVLVWLLCRWRKAKVR